MSDIVLINPPVTFEERYGKLSEAGNNMPSLGLCSLAAVVRERGFNPLIVEAAALGLTLEETLEQIKENRPSWLGISATTLTIHIADLIARKTKAWNPKIKIIVGGPHITAVPIETLKKFLSFDLGVIREGEKTLVDLLTSLKEDKDLKKVKGLVIRDKNEIVLTEPQPFIENLDDLPLPAWDLIPGFPRSFKLSVNCHIKSPMATLMTSRGCVGMCLFCDRSVFGRRVRAFSASKVVEMMEHLYSYYGVKDIQLFDDNFVFNKPRLIEICKKLIQKNWDLVWSCQTRADMVDPEKLVWMKKAGCWQIGYGIESGNQEILSVLKKEVTPEIMRRVIHWTKQVGIETKGFFILGNPLETNQTLQDTLEFILNSDLDYSHTTFFTPYPGSEAYLVADRFGQLITRDWHKIGRGTIDPVFIPNGLNKKELENFAVKIFKKFYFQPKFLFFHLKRLIKHPMLIRETLIGLVSVFKFIFLPIKGKKI